MKKDLSKPKLPTIDFKAVDKQSEAYYKSRGWHWPPGEEGVQVAWMRVIGRAVRSIAYYGDGDRYDPGSMENDVMQCCGFGTGDFGGND